MAPSAEYGWRRIESRQNVRVKELRSAFKRGARLPAGQIAVEGEHLLGEALRSGLRVRTIFVSSASKDLLQSKLLDPGQIGNAEILLLSNDAFLSAAATEHPPGIAALIEPPRFDLDAMLRGNPLVVVTAGLQDPGNLGTLVRSAEAFGATGMILLPGTVSPWNAKALRASSGSAFRLPIVAMEAEAAFACLRAKQVRLLAAAPRGGGAESDFSRPSAILLGNEGAGLPDAWLAQADARVTIHCPGPVESLNAAVAGSVLLYEAARQRQARS